LFAPPLYLLLKSTSGALGLKNKPFSETLSSSSLISFGRLLKFQILTSSMFVQLLSK
jgi:hypothetical protein